MASKPLLSFLLIFSSFSHLGFSDLAFDQILQGIGQDAVAAQTRVQCMQKLLPCQPFLKSPNNPPQACCLPLNEMIVNETECLCTFFNNPELLQSMNISKEDALKLPNACGAHADISKCNTETSSPTSSPSTGTDDTDPADNTTEGSTSSTKMITPYGITHFGVPGFVALLTALVFSAYQA